MFILYITKFNNGLSSESDKWSAFGCYFSSITGFLAFGAVLYTSHLSELRAEDAERKNREQEIDAENRSRIDNERTIFFQLLGLHTKKVDSVVFKDDRASEAFKSYYAKASDYLSIYILIKELINIKDTEDINDELRGGYKKLFSTHFPKCKFDYSVKNFDDFKKKVKSELLYDCIYMPKNFAFNIQPIISRKVQEEDFSYLYEVIKFVADIMYKEYGHILGHYFRNMYYVMDTINNFSDQKNYKELFRAQLSRYELALGVFNAVSSRSGIKMVELLEDFAVFKDLYEEDMKILKFAKEGGVEPSILIKNILNEYKKDVSKKSDK